MFLHKKYLKYGVVMNTLLWSVFIIIPYILSGETFTEYLDSLFGGNTVFDQLKTIALLYAITFPFSWTLIAVFDFFLGFIYPDKWMTVTLIEKHKCHFNHISQSTGLPTSGYNYSFVFQTKNGKKHRFDGSCSQYDSLRKDVEVRVRVKSLMLLEIASAD